MIRGLRSPATVIVVALLAALLLTTRGVASGDWTNGIWWKGLTQDQKVVAVVAAIGTYHAATADPRRPLPSETGFSRGPAFYVAAIDEYYSKPSVETTPFGNLIACLADKPRTPEVCRTLYGL
jgi:hypothetical protein